ncbi:hypothetical protein LUW76_21145 [Actinomadura madurae]|uniref:AfsR/SARP family transcriptional regulator n=1 Tax=Actinomadura madurae TaxID=1993 RepID=UPI00202661E3|nr:hypothetical protein [Actinomadura madurae]URM96637.1 hypothetical protein LUW76_21145 [Actinomadura madurae]
MEGVRYEFRLLGPLEVRRDGVPVPIGAAKLRLLLASLLVDAGRVVTVDTLVYRLWGEAPPAGPAMLCRTTSCACAARSERTAAGWWCPMRWAIRSRSIRTRWTCTGSRRW